MPRAEATRRFLKKPFTAKGIDAFSIPGTYCDGGNLYLQITARPEGRVAKSWTFRFRDRATGRLREMGLGPLKDVSLSQARSKASEMRTMLRDGKDPLAERRALRATLKAQAARSMTFDECAARCITAKSGEWKNSKSEKQWKATLATYASPVFGMVPVSEVDLAMVMRALEPIWLEKTVTAAEVRRRIEAVLSWAATNGFRSELNPARWKGHLEHLLPKPSKVKAERHHPALPYSRMPEFIVALRGQVGIGPLALELAILTACRTGEILGALWSEFDLDRGLWTIPAARMKAGREHVVPLAPRAVEIVRKLSEAKQGEIVFPSDWARKKGLGLSSMALTVLVRRMNAASIAAGNDGWRDNDGVVIVPHGFRSAFRDWAGETTTFQRETIEHALAHRLKDKAEAAYQRGSMLDKRRKLMQAWNDFCASLV